MAEFSTMEIAARCNKSERQVQRWIQSGKLKAEHLQGNRYEVNEDDLQPFLPHALVDSLAERIAALESRMSELELLVHKSRPARPAPSPTSEPPGEWMEGYTPIVDLIHQYGAPETTVMRNMRPYLKKGPWHTSDGRVVTYALDAEGQAEFMRRYGRG